MPTYHVAHLRVQGQNMIIIPLRREPTSEEHAAFQLCAESAGLAGTVVPVWKVAGGFRFIAPKEWRSFFQNSDWLGIQQQLNTKLTCG